MWSVLKLDDFNKEVHLGWRYDASELKKLAAEKKRKRCARCTPCLRSSRHSHLCPLPLCAQVNAMAEPTSPTHRATPGPSYHWATGVVTTMVQCRLWCSLVMVPRKLWCSESFGAWADYGAVPFVSYITGLWGQSCLWIKYMLPSAVGLYVHSDRSETVLCAVAFSVVCCVVHCVGEPSPLSCLVFQCMTVA